MIDPVTYNIDLPAKFDGPLAINDKLEKTEKLHENSIHWPESFATQAGNLYTGLGDGRIVKITSNTVVDICRIGDECGGQHEEHICGRPLGMKFANSGLLYVVDAYHGLFSIDVKSGKKTQLLKSSSVVDDKPLTFLNDLVIDEKSQSIYLSQSSTKWNISMVIASVVEHDTSGRLLKYNLKTKQISVVLKDLAFPNGIEITKDGSALLLAQTSKFDIIKYYINGPKQGNKEKLAVILPGAPDNISRNKRGNYWIGMAGAHTKDSQAIHDLFSEKPFLRKLALQIYKIFSAPIAIIFKLLPYKEMKEIGFEIESFRVIVNVIKQHGIIVEIDENGKIIQSLHSPSGNIAYISEILEVDGHLYLGSWRNKFLAKLKI